jgi:hypothetical protein
MRKQFTHFWLNMAGRVWIDQGGVYSLLIVSDASPAVPIGIGQIWHCSRLLVRNAG